MEFIRLARKEKLLKTKVKVASLLDSVEVVATEDGDDLVLPENDKLVPGPSPHDPLLAPSSTPEMFN